MKASKWLVLGLMALAIAAFVVLGLSRFLSFETLHQSQDALAAQYAANPWGLRAAYFALYVLVASLSLPGAVILTLAGGGVQILPCTVPAYRTTTMSYLFSTSSARTR